ncbi:serine/threonine-protein kinase [Clostridium amazonitimonense]|uniref:serine/threonine-protein kinase n=1 Tax=Clostridium amazonitimonense TaxID=1499689 RepID=UPI0006896FDB|nr:serine/threonine-protein kinase [Clostridium amazonitimonense]
MLNKGFILNEKYEILDIIGNGGTSNVYSSKNIMNNDGKTYAIKSIQLNEKNTVLLAEPYILKKLTHDGIPKIFDVFQENNVLYIVEEFIHGNTLKHYVKEKGFLDEHEVFQIILKLCDILNYLHSQSPAIIYRDLKPSNIMIFNENIKLIDFGTSREFKPNKKHDTVYMYSQGYAAPEQYGLEQSSVETDIYSLGAIMYFMIKGNQPKGFLEPLKDENYDTFKHNKIKSIIKRCMQVDKLDRYKNILEVKKDILAQLENSYVKEEGTKILKEGTIDIELTKTLKEDPKVILKSTNIIKGNLKYFIILICLVLITTSYFILKNLSSRNSDKEKNNTPTTTEDNFNEIYDQKSIQEESPNKYIDKELEPEIPDNNTNNSNTPTTNTPTTNHNEETNNTTTNKSLGNPVKKSNSKSQKNSKEKSNNGKAKGKFKKP